MITQPVVPRIPLVLQGSGGVTIGADGSVSLNIAALTPAAAAALIATASSALPTADPHVKGQPWLNGNVVMISQG